MTEDELRAIVRDSYCENPLDGSAVLFSLVIRSMTARSICKAAAQVRVFPDDCFYFRGLIALGQDRIKVVLNGRRQTDRFEPFALAKRIHAYHVPETSLLEKLGDQVALV